LDNAFDLLEQRVRRAAETLRRLQAENADLKKQLGRAQSALQQAEKALSAAEKQAAAPNPADTQKLDGLQKEVLALRKDKDEIRDRLGRLVEVLEGLD
jgi:FtsZ-binding cell division protein ZapB